VTDDIRPEFVILNHSYEGYGMVIDLLSRTPPFSKMEVGDLSAALRLQLGQGHHVAVVAGPRLLGYAGWLPTLQTIAEPWVMDQGLLVPVLDGTANCIAITIVTAVMPDLARSLISALREKNPGVRFYFKRTGTSRKDKKTSVLNKR
jgi:hypothetical protein